MSDGAATHSTLPVTHFTLPWCGVVSHSTLPPLAATQDPEAPPEPPRRNLHLNQRVQWPTGEQPQPISMGAGDFVLCDAPHAPKSRLSASAGGQGGARLSSEDVRTSLLTPPQAAISQAHTSATVRGAPDWQARGVNVAPQTAWYASGGIGKPLQVHLPPGSAAPQHARHAVSGLQPVGLIAASSATWARWAPRPQTPPPLVARPSTAPSVSPFAYAYNDGTQPKNMGPAFYSCERSGDIPHVVHYSSRHPRTALAAFSVR
jgi:hypothetical protein